MIEIQGTYGYAGESLLPSQKIQNLLTFRDRPVYEVVRLIQGKPLFFTEHVQRLHRSCELLGLGCNLKQDKVKQQIAFLADKCERTDGNIKIIYGIPKGSENPSLFIVFIPHFFPSDEMYAKGVAVTMINMERSNPNIKLAKEKNKAIRDLIDHNSGYFEALMINQEGYITEGSRSNVFFVKNNQVFTSPDEDVLQGITRSKVLQIASSSKLKLEYQRIHHSKIDEFDAAFLSGTSPGVIPIKSIDKISYNVGHALVFQVMKQYNQLVDESIKTS